MRVEGHHRSWEVNDVKSVMKTLAFRDSRGGAQFWMAHGDRKYPCLAIRVSGDIADVHYLPEEYQPGFRCLGGDGLPEGEMTTLLFEGCDPGYGEETPNEFVVPFSVACSIATEFFLREGLPDTVKWFEL